MSSEGGRFFFVIFDAHYAAPQNESVVKQEVLMNLVSSATLKLSSSLRNCSTLCLLHTV
jgi:hypothetical protein